MKERERDAVSGVFLKEEDRPPRVSFEVSARGSFSGTASRPPKLLEQTSFWTAHRDASKVLFILRCTCIKEARQDKVPSRREYAIWRHDAFPYALCGEVASLDVDYVRIKGFEGYRFRHDDLLALVDASRGARLKTDLDALRTAYRSALAAHRAEWRAKVKAILPELPDEGA